MPYKMIFLFFCFAYSRVCAAPPQLCSLAQQASFFVRIVAKRYDWQLEDIYIDVKSGETTGQRTEFQRMLDDCQNGKLDIILTKSISRFGRNTEDRLNLKIGIIKRCTYLTEKWTYLRLFVKRYSSIKQNQALRQ